MTPVLNSIHKMIENMNFKVKKILNFDQRTKFVSLLAYSSDNANEAVILMEKLQFDESSIVLPSFNLSFDSSNSTLINQNDIYTTLFGKDPTNTYDTKFQIIYPATETHILKYSQQPRHIFYETVDMYKAIVLPYIQKCSTPERLQWVYNILDNGQESDRVIFKDDNLETGFYLLPDTKWDCKNVSSMYLLAICKRKDIFSLRDLNATHLPLLNRMLSEIPMIIEKKYLLYKSKIKMFIHYQPSYYHFHLHVVNVDSDVGFGMAAGQAHLLQDVIDCIEKFGSDYWMRRTITYSLGSNHALFSLLSAV